MSKTLPHLLKDSQATLLPCMLNRTKYPNIEQLQAMGGVGGGYRIVVCPPSLPSPVSQLFHVSGGHHRSTESVVQTDSFL